MGNDSSSEHSNPAAYDNGFGMGYTDAREKSGDTDPLQYIVSAHTKDGRDGYKDGYETGLRDEKCHGKDCDNSSQTSSAENKYQSNDIDNSGNYPH